MKYSLYKRGKSPYWYLSFYDRGTRQQISTDCKAKTDAEQAAKKIISDYNKRTYGGGDRTIGELCVKYMAHCQAHNRGWRDNVFRLQRLVAVFPDETSLDLVTPQAMHDFMITIRKQCKTAGTYNRYLATYRRMFNLAVEWEWLQASPIRREKQQKESARMRYFTASELERVVTTAKELSSIGKPNTPQIYMHSIIIIAAYSGLRLGEILNLRWMDIRDNFFTIQRAGDHHSKTGRRRMVPIHPAIVDVLRTLPTTSEYIIDIPRRSPDCVTKLARSIFTKAGVKDARLHDLRHWFASRLAANGVDPVTIKEILGHSSLAMTQRYSHSDALAKSDAVAKLS